jgi:molybdate transport system regulatory protein
VRIDLDTEGRIGPGKIQLLEKIREFGSISAAGRAMDMSYKRAWDLVDEINRICRQVAVERQTGGRNGGGAVLTPFGMSLVARYRKIERDAASAVRKELAALRSDIGKPRKSASR